MYSVQFEKLSVFASCCVVAPEEVPPLPPPPPPHAARRPGTVRSDPLAAARRMKVFRVMRSVMVGALLSVDDERAFRTPAERQSLPCRDLSSRPVVLDVDRHRPGRCVEDVLRRDPAVGALGDNPREQVLFSASDTELLRPDADLEAPAPVESLARHAHPLRDVPLHGAPAH